MIRTTLRLLAIACTLTAALVLVSPSSSSAQAPDAVGWWSRQLPFQDGTRAEDQGVTGQSVGAPVRFRASQIEPTIPGGPVTTQPLPAQPPQVPEPPITVPGPDTGSPNPSVPDGGLWVANDPTGAYAVSAIRFRGDIGSAELTLRFAPGSSTPGPVVACPIISDWAPGPEGAWRDRPAHDCDRLAITGLLSPDATTLTFAIPQGFSQFGERVLDIYLGPKPSSGDPFTVYFEAPDADSLEVLGGQQAPPPEQELPEPEPAALPTTMPPPTSATPAVAAPVGSPTTTATTVEDASPVVDIGGGAGPVPQPVAEFVEPFTESRASRIVAITLLLLMGLGLWYLSGQQVRPPRLLGAMGGGETAPVPVSATEDTGRGIGRFRRERSAPPTKF